MRRRDKCPSLHRSRAAAIIRMSGSSTRLTRKLPPRPSLSFTSFFTVQLSAGSGRSGAVGVGRKFTYLPVSAPLLCLSILEDEADRRKMGPAESSLEDIDNKERADARLCIARAPHTPIGTTSQVQQQLHQQIADANFSLSTALALLSVGGSGFHFASIDCRIVCLSNDVLPIFQDMLPSSYTDQMLLCSAVISQSTSSHVCVFTNSFISDTELDDIMLRNCKHRLTTGRTEERTWLNV